MNKQHDWFAANLFQPDFSSDDFYDIGITPDNTEIKSKDAYKDIPEVIDAFTVNGKFDDNAFTQFYNNALSSYNKYSKSEFDKKILENYEWDPNDWMAPIGASTRDVSAKFVLGKNNPTKIESGIEALGIRSESNFSNRELAQANEVRDANGNKLGYTPNERGGWFMSLSRPTLVLAQYDEDTEEIIDGRKVIHKKGELKLDEYGVPYYEELGDREIYGRDVLHYTDTLSEDGSRWNKYDFFDSDGLDKSIGGTIAKTAFKIAPYFIPYVNYAWGAVNASMEIAQLLPVLGKAANGIFTNNEDTALNKELSKWEGYLERFESSTSDYSRDKMVSVENFGNLVADISGQLWQQRVIGSIPKLLEKTKLLESGSKNIKLGQNMALAYMAGTSAKETYGSFKEAGASDRTAGLAMVGNILALNKLMQNDYFKSAIFRGGWLDEDSVKRPAWGVAKQFMDSLSEVNEEVLTETGKKKFLSKVTGLFTNSIIPGLQKSEFIRASISEGVEETMEEAVSDISKVFTEGLNAIGLTVTKPNKNLNFGWSLEDIASRYGMAFVGGTIGGALFQANHAWETRAIPQWIKDAENGDLAQFTYLIAEGRGGEIKEYYKKLHDKGLLGDSNLSSSKLRTTTGIKGVDETVAESAEKGQSQNDFVYNALLRQVDYIENILKDERFAYPEETVRAMALMGITPKDGDEAHLLKAQILNLSSVNSGFFNEFNTLATKVVKVRAELETLYASESKGETDSEKKASADKLKNNERVKELTEELKQLRKKRDEILEGKLNWYFAGQGLFVLDDDTNRGFLSMTKDKFAQLTFKKAISDLTDYEKERLEEEWKNYQNTTGKQNAYRAYDVYLKLSEVTKGIFESAIPALKHLSNDTIHGVKTNVEKFSDKTKEANSVGTELLTLQSKENKTEEDENKIEQLKIKLGEINQQIKDLRTNTSALLRGEVNGELADFNTLNIDLDSLVIAKEYVESLYKDFAEKKQVMRSEDELGAFYRLVKANPSNSESMKRRWDAFMTAWLEDPELANPADPDPSDVVNKDLSNKLLTQGEEENPTQQKMVDILQELENALGTNYNLAKEKFEEAISFILEQTNYSRQQAEKIIKSVIAKVGNESFYDVVEKFEQLRKTVTHSPIYDILRQFKAGYSDGTLDVASLLEGEINRLAGYGDLSEYVISSKQVVEELKETAHLLNVIKALINGSTSGLNKAINVLKLKQSLPLITELDKHTAKLLTDDIDFIIKRINGLLNIASWNNNKKLKAHKESEIKLKPLTLSCLLDPDFAEGFKKLDVDVDDIWRKVNKYGLDLKYINENNWQNFEETRIAFESELRKAILEKNNGDFSDKLVECFGPSLYKMQTTKIDPETSTVTAYDLMWYVADIITLDANSFYPRYNNVLTTYRTPGEEASQRKELAPVYGQELAIRRNVSMALNPELYNNLLDKIQKLYPEAMGSKPVLANMAVTLGGAGTGKTVAIAGISASMLAFDDDIEYVYLAPTEKQANNLARNVQKEGTILTTDSLDEFFQDKPKFEYELDKKTGNKTGKIKWNYTLNDKQMWVGKKKRKVLIVDEATLFSGAQLQALSEIALRENGIIWALGDGKQNASLVKMDDDVMQHTGLEDFTIVKSPELTTALRPSTVGKFDNAIQLDIALSEINRQAAEVDAKTIGDYDKIANDILDVVEFKYYEDKDTGEFYGERIVDDSEELVGIYLNQFAKLAPGRVAYITDKNVSVPKGVEKVTLDKAQGGEWDYVIIDKKWNTDSKYDVLRDVYTLTQRSTKGTIIVNNGLKFALSVTSTSNPTAAEPMSLDSKDLKEFVQWKKNSLGGYTMDMNFIDDFKNAYREDEDEGDEGNNNKDDEGDEGEPDPEEGDDGKIEVQIVSVTPPDPTTNQSQVPGTVNEAKSDSSGSINSSDEELLPWETTPPLVNPDSSPTPEPEVKQEEISGPPAQQQKSGTKKPKLIPENHVITNEVEYFNMLYSDEYWNSHKDDIQYLTDLGFNTDEIKNIALLLSGAIKVEGTNIKRKIDLSGLTSNGLANRKLIKFINSDTCDILLDIVPNAKNSTMFATFTDNVGKQFRIPICIIPKGKNGKCLYGRYHGQFKLIDGPSKQKGEWLTISKIKERFPWLRIFNTWQVISGNERKIEGRNDFSKKTKRYLIQNLGKVFTLASDNLYLSRKQDRENIYSLEAQPDGTNYTYKDHTDLVNFGLIKTASLSDVIQYSFLWSKKIGMLKSNNPITIGDDHDSWLREMVGLDTIPDEKLNHRRYQILSSDNCSRLLSKLMNLAMSGNTTLSTLISRSFVESFQHPNKLQKEGDSRVYYKNGIRFKSGKNWYWMEYNFNTSSYDVYQYEHNTYRVGSLITSLSVTPENGRFPFKQLSQFVQQIDKFDIATRKFNEDWTQIGNPYSQCVSNQISLMFQNITDESVYSELDTLLVGDKYFLDGRIYTNVAGASGNNAFLPNGVSRKFVGPKQEYVTDASEWTPSTYAIDENSIDRGEAKIEEHNEFKDRLEEITKLVSPIININDILNTTSLVQTDYIAKLEEIVNEINLRLKASANDWNYKQLTLNGYDYQLTTVSDLEGWLQEQVGIQGDVIIDFNALENFKFGVFSVSLSNFYIKKDGNQWSVYPMKSYEAFKPMIEFWNQNKDLLVRSVPNFEKYLSEIYGQSTRVSREIAETLRTSSDPNVKSLQKLLEDYLRKRIDEGEC